MKFPYPIKYRDFKAKVYAKTEQFPFYRLVVKLPSGRKVTTHKTFGEAREAGEKALREQAKGSLAMELGKRESQDAVAALGVLSEFYRATGTKTSLHAAVMEWTAARKELGGRDLMEAVRGYLSTVATVKRQDLKEAVEQFLAGRETLTRSKAGERSQLAKKYVYELGLHLKSFAATFPNTAVCDLGKEHLDTFFASLQKLSPKSRNHRRAGVKMLLEWCVRQDYLPRNNRLLEAESMRREVATTGEIEFYTPQELRALLEASQGPLRVLIALSGLGGLRTQETLRLTWQDLWRVPGHVEISTSKSKTRQRRLVPVCPSLAAWLEPYRGMTSGLIWQESELAYHRAWADLCELTGLQRKANGLRHAYITFAFVLRGEIEAAKEAGTSPSMLYQHYRGLATRPEGEAWFAVAPAKAANIIPIAMASPQDF